MKWMDRNNENLKKYCLWQKRICEIYFCSLIWFLAVAHGQILLSCTVPLLVQLMKIIMSMDCLLFLPVLTQDQGIKFSCFLVIVVSINPQRLHPGQDKNFVLRISVKGYRIDLLISFLSWIFSRSQKLGLFLDLYRQVNYSGRIWLLGCIPWKALRRLMDWKQFGFFVAIVPGLATIN